VVLVSAPEQSSAHGPGPRDGQIDEIDGARAREYGLLATLLARAPDHDLIGRLAALRGDASPLGIAHLTLADAAARIDADAVAQEFFDLFIGLGRGELLPYGSYYLSGFLHDRPLARLRADLGALGIERSGRQAEPEDHAAILCEIMAGIVGGLLPGPLGTDRAIFKAHLEPWISRFFADLENAKSAAFYRAVGMVGRVFMEIETEAFALP
jgi:TorA maturation chaperone TorD